MKLINSDVLFVTFQTEKSRMSELEISQWYFPVSYFFQLFDNHFSVRETFCLRSEKTAPNVHCTLQDNLADLQQDPPLLNKFNKSSNYLMVLKISCQIFFCVKCVESNLLSLNCSKDNGFPSDCSHM